MCHGFIYLLAGRETEINRMSLCKCVDAFVPIFSDPALNGSLPFFLTSVTHHHHHIILLGLFVSKRFCVLGVLFKQNSLSSRLPLVQVYCFHFYSVGAERGTFEVTFTL